MRVLWLTCTAASASLIVGQSTHARGWIASLSDMVRMESSIDLAIAFFENSREDFKFEFDNITYYPIKDEFSTLIKRLKSRWLGKLWDTNLSGIEKVIDDFKPDIIQVFGTESGMGDIVGNTKIPIIIHIQGLVNPYALQWRPIDIGIFSILIRSTVRELVARRDLLSEYAVFKRIAKREEHVIKSAKYFMGRTGWDERVVSLFNPDIKYFHCDEVLRPFLYKYAGKWQNNANDVVRLVSVVNPEMYKGLDIVLETAEILKNKTDLNFEWNIIGVNRTSRVVKMMEIGKNTRFTNTSVNFKGIRQGDELIFELLRSSLFIHPSRADNSPNSVCEAMLLGMPVIAGYVGGIPSLIEHEYDGLLYNSSDPFDLAGIILQCAKNKISIEKIGENASKTALNRHNPGKIVDRLKYIYNVIISRSESS